MPSDSDQVSVFFDELSRVRILAVEKCQETEKLNEECKAFVDGIGSFKSIAGEFIALVEQLAKAVEAEKMRAIGARAALKSCAKERESKIIQLNGIILEKQKQLQRYKIQNMSLASQGQHQREQWAELNMAPDE